MVQRPEARLRTHGAVQLFTSPHPRRRLKEAGKVSIFTHPSYNPAYFDGMLRGNASDVGEREKFNLNGILEELYRKYVCFFMVQVCRLIIMPLLGVAYSFK